MTLLGFLPVRILGSKVAPFNSPPYLEYSLKLQAEVPAEQIADRLTQAYLQWAKVYKTRTC